MPASPDLATLRSTISRRTSKRSSRCSPGRQAWLPLEARDKTDPHGRRAGSAATAAAFSLLFVAPEGPWLPQAIYPLTHPALGAMEIFLVPIGPTSGGNGYYAMFR